MIPKLDVCPAEPGWTKWQGSPLTEALPEVGEEEIPEPLIWLHDRTFPGFPKAFIPCTKHPSLCPIWTFLERNTEDSYPPPPYGFFGPGGYHCLLSEALR